MCSKKVTELSERIQKLESNASDNPSAVASNNPAVTTSKELEMSAITSTVASMLQEEREEDSRRLNLIIHGIPESTSEIPAERKEHDTELIAMLFN